MFERIIAEVPVVTQVFLVVIVLLWIYFNIRYDERAAAYAPTILTTIGILATFVGIALGLLDLDSKDIQEISVTGPYLKNLLRHYPSATKGDLLNPHTRLLRPPRPILASARRQLSQASPQPRRRPNPPHATSSSLSAMNWFMLSPNLAACSATRR